MRIPLLFIMAIALDGTAVADESSTCFGSTSDGRLENGWRLPAKGPNFEAYSDAAHFLGRTYVHSTVHNIVLDAYEALAETRPNAIFVYGETGFRNGGEFAPHRTHRNGLSVDFMVPVLNEDGESVALPGNALNRYGYDLEFDGDGHLDGLRIDFEALAEHIYRLHEASLEHDADIWRVIFDPQLQPLLAETEYWPSIEDSIQFSQRRSWVRHDDHYHVDFEIACDSE